MRRRSIFTPTWLWRLRERQRLVREKEWMLAVAKDMARIYALPSKVRAP